MRCVVSAGAVILKPLPTPKMKIPVVLFVALPVGVPPVQLYPKALPPYWFAGPVPTIVKLLIWFTPALWSKLVAVVSRNLTLR